MPIDIRGHPIRARATQRHVNTLIVSAVGPTSVSYRPCFRQSISAYGLSSSKAPCVVPSTRAMTRSLVSTGSA